MCEVSAACYAWLWHSLFLLVSIQMFGLMKLCGNLAIFEAEALIHMKRIKQYLHWSSGIVMCVTGMLIPSQELAEGWYWTFFISLILFIFLQPSEDN